MALYTEHFTIINNSGYTLVLDAYGSSNLGDGDWPATVAPNTTTASFTQSGHTNVNPTAVYTAQGANPTFNIYLHFYCTGLDPAVHVNMTMVFSNNKPLAGSSIAENNTYSGAKYETNNTTLSITTTGNGSSSGQAVFTIGG